MSSRAQTLVNSHGSAAEKNFATSCVARTRDNDDDDNARFRPSRFFRAKNVSLTCITDPRWVLAATKRRQIAHPARTYGLSDLSNKRVYVKETGSGRLVYSVLHSGAMFRTYYAKRSESRARSDEFVECFRRRIQGVLQVTP